MKTLNQYYKDYKIVNDVTMTDFLENNKRTMNNLHPPFVTPIEDMTIKPIGDIDICQVQTCMYGPNK